MLVYFDKRWKDGENCKDNFWLKTCVEFVWGLLCLFFKERTDKREQLFLDLSIIIGKGKKKNWSDRLRIMKIVLHPPAPCVLLVPALNKSRKRFRPAFPSYTLIEENSL